MSIPEYKRRVNIVLLVMSKYNNLDLHESEVDSIIKALYIGNVDVKNQDRTRIADFVKKHEDELKRMEEET